MFPFRGAQFNDRRVQFQYAEITYTIVMDGFFRVPVGRGMQTLQTVVGRSGSISCAAVAEFV